MHLDRGAAVLSEHGLPHHGSQETLVRGWVSGGVLHPDPGTQDILPTVSFLDAIPQNTTRLTDKAHLIVENQGKAGRKTTSKWEEFILQAEVV